MNDSAKLPSITKLVTPPTAKSPYFFLCRVGSWIFAAEVLVMFLFMILPELPRLVEPFVDGALLSVLVAPALYQFLYKPLTVDNSNRKLIEHELRRSRDQLQKQAKQLQDYSESLEEKVAQRTLELTEKNTQL